MRKAVPETLNFNFTQKINPAHKSKAEAKRAIAKGRTYLKPNSNCMQKRGRGVGQVAFFMHLSKPSLRGSLLTFSVFSWFPRFSHAVRIFRVCSEPIVQELRGFWVS